MVLSPLTKLPFGSCAIYSNADVYRLNIINLFVAVSEGTCFWFRCHWCGVPCGIDYLVIILRRPSAAACAGLVRWQLMHRWPGASAQFEHLWGQRIGILSMYDSRANGLMRLLGIEAAYLLSSGEWQWVKPTSASILWAGKGRPSQDVGLWWAFHVSSMLCVWLALHVDDGSLLGLCVLSPHLCHQSSVL